MQPISKLPAPLARLCLLLALAAPAVAQPAPEPAADAEPVKQIELDVHPRHLIFTEPKRPDGTIDYIAALNNKYSEGVTKDNNAYRDLFVLFDYERDDLWEVDEQVVAGKREALGLTREDLRAGPHLVPLEAFLEERGYDRQQIDAYWERHETDPLKAVQEPDIRDWLADNEPALQAAMAAVQKPRYWSPMIAGDEAGSLVNVMLPSLSHHRQLARMMGEWAYLHIARGRHAKAVNIIAAMRRLALLQSEEPVVISNLVAISLDALILKRVKAIVAHRAMPDEPLAKLLRVLRERPARKPMADTVFEGEACMALDSYMQIGTGRMGDNGPLGEGAHGELKTILGGRALDLGRGLRDISVYYQQLGRAMKTEDYADRVRLVEMHQQRFEQQIIDINNKRFIEVGDVKIPNPAAMLGIEARTDAFTALIMSILMPAFESASRTETRTLASEQCTYAVLAVERYRLNHGQLPESLNDLVPDYLDKLPTDPFSGEPVLYKRGDNGFTVYTVGDNLKDDGGVEFLDEPQEPDDEAVFGGRTRERGDWVVEIEWPKEK